MKPLFLFIAIFVFLVKTLSQTVGISTLTPSVKLQVNNDGNVRPTMKLFDSTANGGYPVIQFQNAGGNKFWQIGGNIDDASPLSSYFDIYSVQAPGYVLTVRGNGNVGIGNSVPVNKLDVAADLNITGALKVAGNTGTDGQVLASNGALAPAWRNVALSNNTRFSVTVSSGSGNGVWGGYTTVYNTNPANVTITTGSVGINYSGLYHFEGFVFSIAGFTAAQSFLPLFTFTVQTSGLFPTSAYQLMNDGLITQTGTNQYQKGERFAFDLYIIAGSSVTFYKSYSYQGTGSVLTSGWLTGYLVSE